MVRVTGMPASGVPGAITPETPGSGDAKLARTAEVVRQVNSADFDVVTREVTAVEAIEIVSGYESRPGYGSG